MMSLVVVLGHAALRALTLMALVLGLWMEVHPWWTATLAIVLTAPVVGLRWCCLRLARAEPPTHTPASAPRTPR